MTALGRALIVTGLLIVAAGAILLFADRLPFRIGHLPGDLQFKGRGWTVSFPLMTSLILSVVLSLVLWLVNRR